MTFDLATLVATAIPLCCLAAVWMLSRGGMRALPLVVLALAWGIGSTWVVVGFNDRWNQNYGFASLVVVGAPIMEEIAKSSLLPLLAWSRRCSWFVDGAVIGLAAGTGFAIRENWVYLSGSAPGDGFSVALARVTSTNLMHAGCTAIVGAALVGTWSRGVVFRIGGTLAALACAMGLHSGFNRLTRQGEPNALAITLTGVAVFFVAAGIVATGIPISSRWARIDLARRGASASEQVALAGGRQGVDVLDGFESRYGGAAAERAEQLIDVQRRIAIGRATHRLDATALAELERSADALRRSLGLHAMMWLRSHLPVDPSSASLWADLAIDGGAETSPEPVREASGMWARFSIPDTDPTGSPTDTKAED